MPPLIHFMSSSTFIWPAVSLPVPLTQRGGIKRQFDDQGLPLCQAGLLMPLKTTFICHTSLIEHERGRYACPLLFPTRPARPAPSP
ncbi:MAG: hypothetical protein HS114_19260 [Anaerolineales bacterium]|nr:hypothetical protein [Anaerolineales bacterium]